ALPRTQPSGHRFDVASAAMNAATFVLFISALGGVAHAAPTGVVAAQFAGAAMLGFFFVRRQIALPAPMLPVDLFRRPVFALTVATSVCSFLAQTSAYVALPFLFQTVGGMSVTGTGLLM